jgi:hypothetical protein
MGLIYVLSLLVLCVTVISLRSLTRPLITPFSTAPLAMSTIVNSDYELSLRSPCKINLFLRITGKRANGYHDLASLFQTISLCDYMHFSRLPAGATRDELVCSDPLLQVDESNLVIKALNLMRSKSSVKDVFLKVRLDKIVPMQAGLGGYCFMQK